MKKKRFYKNAKRNQTWTEEEKGRKIDFADKYIYSDTYSDKYDYLRPKAAKRKYFNKHGVRKFFKRLGIAVLCFVLISSGYMMMDVYMQRHAMPKPNAQGGGEIVDAPLNEVALDLHAEYANSVSLDGGVMLEAVISELDENGYDSVVIDIKRREGTIGYQSALANVDTFGAVAFPATDLKASAEMLKNEDILAVGIVNCYLDNLVPQHYKNMAITKSNGVLYRDSKDNTYLNPDSDLTYNYIKGIIQEAYELGVTVFVLDGVNLPNDIKDSYNGGFDYLASRLYKDLGTDIKLLQPVYREIKLPKEETTAKNDEDKAEDKTEEETKEEDEKPTEKTAQQIIAEALGKPLENDEIYFIKAKSDKKLIKEKLEEQGISNYILAE